jgi:hypothetical protein
MLLGMLEDPCVCATAGSSQWAAREYLHFKRIGQAQEAVANKKLFEARQEELQREREREGEREGERERERGQRTLPQAKLVVREREREREVSDKHALAAALFASPFATFLAKGLRSVYAPYFPSEETNNATGAACIANARLEVLRLFSYVSSYLWYFYICVRIPHTTASVYVSGLATSIACVCVRVCVCVCRE